MMVRFTDIFSDETKRGFKIQSSEYLCEGKYPIIDQGKELVAGYTNLEDGLFLDVPVLVFGDHTRVIKYVDEPFFLGADGVKVLKIKMENVDYKYLFYLLESAKIPNTGYNRHYKWLKELEIKLPSFREQRKIAAELDQISTLIDKSRQQLDKLDLLVKAKFVEMFGTFPANEYNWAVGKIRDVINEARYGSSLPAVDGGKYPYLRMNNITYEGELDLSDVKRIDVPESELPKCTVQRGDVLFNRTNSKGLVGKTCVYDRDETMVLAGFVIRVRVNQYILPEFLSAFLNTEFSKRMLSEVCKTAIGQANINAQEMKNIGIYIPPIEIQQAFVTFKKQVDKSKRTIKCSLEKLETLKKAQMQKYFG